MEIDIKPGDVIGSYRFKHYIGHGGHGEVWEGHHQYLDQPVAIKMIDTRDLDEQDLQRVEQECRIGGQLTHKEHIVEVRDAFPVGDRFFIVMELMADDLGGYLHVNPHPNFDLTLTWALNLCTALEKVHALKVIHRDIKPQNILLTEDAKAKLSDFGIAHLRGLRSTTGDQPGTPGYEAPEQQANLPVGSGVDIYALCAVFFEVWTGQKYFRYRNATPGIVREEMELLLAENYPQLVTGWRDKLIDVVLAGLCPRPERITLANLQAALTAIRDNWQLEKPADQAIITTWARPSRYERAYLTCLADAYRTFFRDRFVHQAMDAVETPGILVAESALLESPADALLFEMVALVDEDKPPVSEGIELLQPGDSEAQTHPIPDLHAGLAEYRTIVLLGEPGSGKTSALLWLLGTWSDMAAESHADRLPVFVSLSRYASGVFEDFLAREWSTSLAETLRVDKDRRAALEGTVAPLADSLEDHLARGRVVLLLDALNELPRGAGYQERLTQLRYFIEAVSRQGNWVMVSCRQQDYTEALRPLQRVEIRPLDDERVKRFLTIYLGAEAATALWATLGESRYARLRELTRNPFLLAALATVATKRPEEGELPTARAALLDRLATASLKWEKRKGHPDWVPQQEQEKVLAGLALAMTMLGRTVVDKAELSNWLPEAWFFDPGRRTPLLDAVLWLTRGARLARWTPGPNDGTVAFEHQLWQEYYTSRLLARLDNPEWRGLARHVTGQDELANPFDVLRPYLHDPSWRGTVLLTSARLDEINASQFISHILHAGSLWEEYLYRDTLLTASCLAEGTNVQPAVADTVLARLEAARQLGIRPLTRRADQARIAMLVALDRAGDLLALTQDREAWWEVRLAAVEALETMGRMDEATEAWLAMARNRQLHSKTRQEAAERLEKAGQVDAAIEAWSALEKDPRAGKGVRREARRALKRLR